MRLKQSVIFFVLLATVLLSLYAPLFGSDPLISQDDQRLIEPLTSVNSISDYVETMRTAQIMDLQPLRDLSFLADLKLSSLLGISTFRLTNLCIWYSALLIFFVGLRRRKIDWWIATFVVSVVALHPLAIQSVAWVAARKHLLACSLIVLATTLSFDRPFAALGAYFASLLAQPIFLLWPAWSFLNDIKRKIRRTFVWAIGALVALLAANLNYAYYSGGYVAQNGGHAKLLGFENLDYARQALGRAFLQILYPLHLKLYYYAANETLNTVGFWLFVLTLSAFVFFRPLRRARYASIALFFVFSLLPILVSQTNIFLSDTYLLGGLFAFGTLIAFIMNSLRVRKLAFVLLAGYLAGECVLSFAQVRAWKSTSAFCATMSKEAPSEQMLSCHGMFLIDEQKYSEAVGAAEALQALDSNSHGASELFARLALEDHARPFADKLILLKRGKNLTPRSHYFAGLMYAQNSNFEEAEREFLAAREAGPAFIFAFRDSLEDFLADQMAVCSKLGREDCEALMTSTQALTGARPWDQKRFERRRQIWRKL